MSKANGNGKANGKQRKNGKAKKKPAVMGAPRKLTDTKVEELISLIAGGLSRVKAAELMGIHASTIANEAGRNPEFLDSLTRAEAECCKSHVDVITKAGKEDVAGDWRASAFLLERKFKKEFAKEVRVDKKVSGTVEHRVAGLMPDQVREQLALRREELLGANHG
jgi:hypothetical protein